VVTIAHLARVPAARMAEAKAGDDAAATAWLDLKLEGEGYALSREGRAVEALAFDHDEILAAAVRKIRASGGG
jgi:hypothetical protein